MTNQTPHTQQDSLNAAASVHSTLLGRLANWSKKTKSLIVGCAALLAFVAGIATNYEHIRKFLVYDTGSQDKTIEISVEDRAVYKKLSNEFLEALLNQNFDRVLSLSDSSDFVFEKESLLGEPQLRAQLLAIQPDRLAQIKPQRDIRIGSFARQKDLVPWVDRASGRVSNEEIIAVVEYSTRDGRPERTVLLFSGKPPLLKVRGFWN